MSEPALASAAPSQRDLMPVRARRKRLNPLEALEGGFALFRSTFAEEAWRYYAGSAPLVVCFIPIWVVNGQIRISGGALLIESALLAGAYLLRVWMVGTYMQRVRERAFGTPRPGSTGKTAQAAALGRLLAWKMILSAGSLITLPTFAAPSWFYGASQFASLEAREDGTERHSFTGCLGLSSQCFGEGLLLFLMLFPLWIAVWLNGAILVLLVPPLLPSIFGVHTLLSTPMGMYALVQSSAFWLSLLAGAWLALDPVVKCTFVIVYQHLRSRREGDDLRGLLASLPREQRNKAQFMAAKAVAGKVTTVILVAVTTILLVVSVTTTVQAAQAPSAGTTSQTLSDSGRDERIQQLRQALDQESQRAIYRWHDAEHPSPPNWFDKLLVKIGRAIDRAWNAFWNLLRKLWPRGLNLSLGTEQHSTPQLKNVRLWLIALTILTVGAAGVLFWLRRQSETASLSIPVAVSVIPDLSDSAMASERSEDEWFALARQLEGEGELRFALRAAYFGLIAGLAQREWLTIRRDRTNREYLNEFTRRWRRRPQAAVQARSEIPETLRGSLRQFDRVWYGDHAVSPEAVTTYRLNQREFLNDV